MSGHYAMLRQRTQRIVAANADRMSEAAIERITGEPAIALPRPQLTVRPIFEKGRYIPKTLTGIIELVARLADISPEAIWGAGRKRPLVDARACVANLAEEFAPRQSCAAVDDAMLRGHGMADWYRSRHRDRLEGFPSYAALYQRCHAELAK